MDRVLLETYTEAKALVENPQYREQRRRCLGGLSDDMIDKPIVDQVNAFNRLPYCFTLQCCYGHFIYNGQSDPYNMEPLSRMDNITSVEYRIAYIALCIEYSDPGIKLIESLKSITRIEPDNIQFCCAEWFWERQVNSYTLQVEPDRYKAQDKAVLAYEEALKIEKIRNEFFVQLNRLLGDLHGRDVLV
jgi:hypothetical protein